jgi:dTDP-4-dehydrorhamnose reductase
VALAAERTTVMAASRSGVRVPGAPGIRLDLTVPGAAAAVLAELRPRAVVHAAAANTGARPHPAWLTGPSPHSAPPRHDAGPSRPGASPPGASPPGASPPEAEPPDPPPAGPGTRPFGPSDFEDVNVVGTQLLAQAVRDLGDCRLVHVSTDMVHDGRQAPYADDHPASPLSAYGRSKARGEDVVLAACPDAAVVRTSLIYGLAHMDRGTAGFADTLGGGGALVLFEDVWRQPVWVDSLAAALVDLVLDRPQVAGRLNVTGRQVLSRAGFGHRLLDYWRVPGRDRVSGGTAAGLADVPLDLRLRLDRADALGYDLPGVDDVLSRARRP